MNKAPVRGQGGLTSHLDGVAVTTIAPEGALVMRSPRSRSGEVRRRIRKYPAFVSAVIETFYVK